MRKSGIKSYIVISLLLSITFVISSNFSDITSADDFTQPIQIGIIGETGKVYDPIILCNSENNIFISWREVSDYYYNSDVGAYDYNDTLFIQQIDLDGSLMGDAVQIFNHTEIPFDVKSDAEYKIILDSNNNFNVFWYIRETYGELYPSQTLNHLFYKKLDSSLNNLTNIEKIFTFNSTLQGCGHYIDSLILDSYDRFHILFLEQFYLYVDNYGLFLDSFDLNSLKLGDDYGGNSYSLANDGQNNTFIVSLTYHDYIYVTRFQNIADGIFNFTTTETYFNDTGTLGNAEIFYKEGQLYVSCSVDPNRYYLIKEVDYNGTVIQDADLAIRKGILSRSQDVVYSFAYVGVEWLLEDMELHYTLFSFNNDQLFETREILRVMANHSYQYSPNIFGFNCIDDLDGNLWLAWLFNDGSNQYQVMYWKMSLYGNSLIPITKIAPDYYQYEVIFIPEFSSLSLFTLSTIFIAFISYMVFRRRKKLLTN